MRGLRLERRRRHQPSGRARFQGLPATGRPGGRLLGAAVQRGTGAVLRPTDRPTGLPVEPGPAAKARATPELRHEATARVRNKGGPTGYAPGSRRSKLLTPALLHNAHSSPRGEPTSPRMLPTPIGILAAIVGRTHEPEDAPESPRENVDMAEANPRAGGCS